MTKTSTSQDRIFDRLMLRSSFQSLFWAVILDKKKKSGLTLSALADRLGVNKSYISRSFASPPNWQIDKISDMCEALDVELELVAHDINTGEVYTPVGKAKFSDAVTSDPSLLDDRNCKSATLNSNSCFNVSAQ